jgi:hypothetical protein
MLAESITGLLKNLQIRCHRLSESIPKSGLKIGLMYDIRTVLE